MKAKVKLYYVRPLEGLERNGGRREKLLCVHRKQGKQLMMHSRENMFNEKLKCISMRGTWNFQQQKRMQFEIIIFITSIQIIMDKGEII